MGNLIIKGNRKWKIFLDPHKESEIPIDITIKNSVASNIITLRNILFGDVFVCTGQSNMLFVV